MKTFYYFVLIAIGVIGISSCSQEEYEQNKTNNQETKSMLKSDSICLDSTITPLIVNPDSIKQPLTRAYSSPYEDQYFSSNIWAIRDLPASSGIPYLIYSYNNKTQISVVQYNSNPNNKILFTL